MVMSHDFLFFFSHSPGLAARVTWMDIWVGDLLGWRELQGTKKTVGGCESMDLPLSWEVLSEFFMSLYHIISYYIIRISDDSKFFLG